VNFELVMRTLADAERIFPDSGSPSRAHRVRASVQLLKSPTTLTRGVGRPDAKTHAGNAIDGCATGRPVVVDAALIALANR